MKIVKRILGIVLIMITLTCCIAPYLIYLICCGIDVANNKVDKMVLPFVDWLD